MVAESEMIKNMSASGAGKGFIVYNIQNKNFSESINDLTINLEMTMPENNMKFTATAHSTTKFTLEKIN